MASFPPSRYDIQMNDIKARLKALGLTQITAGRIIGLSAVTVNRQVRGLYPLSPALIYLMETWALIPAARRERIRKRVSPDQGVPIDLPDFTAEQLDYVAKIAARERAYDGSKVIGGPRKTP
jgi:hypothetical protein